MQMYPSGGYAQDDDYGNMDEYQYNNPYSHQSMQAKPDQWIPPPKQTRKWDYSSKDDYHHNNGSDMQMNSNQWIAPPKQTVKGDYSSQDDYHYKNGSAMQMKPDQWIAPPKQTVKGDYSSQDDYHYKNGSAMQMKPDQWIAPPKQTIKGDYVHKDEYHYNNGSGMQMRPNQWGPPEKNSYHHMQGYGGGYDQKSETYFKIGLQGYTAQCSEAIYEKEQQYDTWNKRNGYPGLGKHVNAYNYHGSLSEDLEMSGGYGAHHGSPASAGEHGTYHHYEQKKGPSPVWRSKGIRD